MHTLTVLHVEWTGAHYVGGSHSAVSNTEMNKEVRGSEDRRTGSGQGGQTLTCWFSEEQMSPLAGRERCCKTWQVYSRACWWETWL